MRISELLRLVWMNLSQNKFKVILTAVGIIVGSATIMMVLAIGTGGKLEVAEQFKNLNAGAIDISYESNATEFGSSGGGFGGGLGGGGMPSGGSMPSGGGMPSFSGGGMPGGMSFCDDDRMNQENITLSTDDMEDLLVFVPGIADATISYTTTVDVEGGDLDSSSSYTIASVKYNYAEMSNMTMLVGDFLTEENDENKEKYCVLGYTAAKEIFGSASEAYESVLYIDDRPYVVSGVLDEMGKPHINVYEAFLRRFQRICQKEGKELYLIPYLMSSHPGSTMRDAVELALFLKKHHLRPQQVQDFYPTPGTISTAMFWTGLNPYTMEPVFVPRTPEEKRMQRALLQYFKPENHDIVEKALIMAKRRDLIGTGKDCLIAPSPQRAAQRGGSSDRRKPGARSQQSAPKQQYRSSGHNAPNDRERGKPNGRKTAQTKKHAGKPRG